MKIAIIDDLETDQNILVKKLDNYFADKKIDYSIFTYKNAETFLEEFEPNFYDIIFMDI